MSRASDPQNRAERRAAMRRAKRAAGAIVSVSGAALGTTAAILAPSPGAALVQFEVNDLADPGDGLCDATCTLRDAIENANTNPGADLITFQPGLTGTILLANQLDVKDDVEIRGPGASAITVSGQLTSRIFYLYGGGPGTAIDVTISGLTLTQGVGPFGGAILGTNENLTLRDSVVTGNLAVFGGGIATGGNFTMSNTTVQGNYSYIQGGGLFLIDQDAASSITDSRILGNRSLFGIGGGAWLYGNDRDFTIANTTISGNTAAISGGGVFFYDTDGGDVIVRNTTVSGNTASTGAGGGFYIGQPNNGTVRFFNSTVSGNTAPQGAGIFFYADATEEPLYLVESTVTANNGGGTSVASLGAQGQGHGHEGTQQWPKPDPTEAPETNVGAAQTGDEMFLIGTIMAGNLGTADLPDAGVVNSNSSLIGTVSGTTTVNNVGGTILGADPMLGPLANNGGPTQTHALLAGSPAINTGPNPLPAFPGNAFDQRGPGFARVIGLRVDIGAYEFVPPAVAEPRFTG